MLSFKKRSYQKELLDSNDIPFSDIKRNMKELDVINRHLGGHAITLQGFVALLKSTSKSSSTLHIVEIGCGGGDNLRAIKQWALAHKQSVQLWGIDTNKECIEYAEQQRGNGGVRFIHSDYIDVQFDKPPDIIFSSLFCHHFTDEELVTQLAWMKKNSTLGFFINDLHRHPLAYYSIATLTLFFSRSYLVRNDAPLSVRRGFKRKDWAFLFSKAGIVHFNCQWRWAFRWLVTCQTNAKRVNI